MSGLGVAAGMDALSGHRVLRRFAASRGPVALELAMHAAVPQGLRPELVALLRRNFLPHAVDDRAADADVLLASFCEPLGNDYFQFDSEVRRVLLDHLVRLPGLEGSDRIAEVARFLLAWTADAERRSHLSADPVFLDFLEVQRWVALAFLDPAAAAEQLAAVLARVGEVGDGAGASVQVGGLASVLALPLGSRQDLLAYAAGVQALESGQQVRARRLLGGMTRDVTVGSVVLSPGARLLGLPVAAPNEVGHLDATAPERTRRALELAIIGNSTTDFERRLASALTTYGVTLLLPYEGANQQASVREHIDDRIALADACVVAVSGPMIGVLDKHELQVALRTGKPWIAILAGGNPDDLPSEVAHRPYLDFRDQSRFEVTAHRLATQLAQLPIGLAPIHGILQSQPLDLIASHTMEEVRSAVLQPGSRNVLIGPAGSGKTSLVRMVVQDEAVRHVYPDGIHVLSMGSRPPETRVAEWLLSELGSQLALGAASISSEQLARRLSRRQCLLVVDDVNDTRELEALHSIDALGPRASLLVTSRSRIAAGLANSRAHLLEPSMEVARSLIGRFLDPDSELAAALIRELELRPLSLRTLAGLLESGLAADQLISRVRDAHASIGLSAEAFVKALPEASRARDVLLVLVLVTPEDVEARFSGAELRYLAASEVGDAAASALQDLMSYAVLEADERDREWRRVAPELLRAARKILAVDVADERRASTVLLTARRLAEAQGDLATASLLAARDLRLVWHWGDFSLLVERSLQPAYESALSRLADLMSQEDAKQLRRAIADATEDHSRSIRAERKGLTPERTEGWREHAVRVLATTRYGDLGGDSSAAIVEVDGLLATAPPEESPVVADLLHDRGRLLEHAGRVDEALLAFQQALERHREAGDATNEALDLRAMGLAALRLGRFEDAREWLRQALEVDEHAGSILGAASDHRALASLLTATGSMAEAERAWREALRLHQQVGERASVAEDLLALSDVVLLAGRNDEAEALVASAIELRGTLGDSRGWASDHQRLSIILLRQQRLDEAERAARHAVEQYRLLQEPRGLASSLATLASVLRALGRLDDATACLRQALDLRTAIGDDAGRADDLHALGLILQQLGHRDEAITLLGEARQVNGKYGRRAEEAAVLLALGLASAEAGDDETALLHFAPARGLLEQTGDVAADVTVQLAMASSLWRLGSRTQARELAVRAQARAMELRDDTLIAMAAKILAGFEPLT